MEFSNKFTSQNKFSLARIVQGVGVGIEQWGDQNMCNTDYESNL